MQIKEEVSLLLIKKLRFQPLNIQSLLRIRIKETQLRKTIDRHRPVTTKKVINPKIKPKHNNHLPTKTQISILEAMMIQKRKHLPTTSKILQFV